MVDLLLTDVRVRGVDGPVDVRVADGRIAEIGRCLVVGDVPTIGGGGRPVLPGLVEPHLHVDGCREHVRTVFDLAERFDVDVDVHADFATGPDDPRQDLAGYVAEVTAERGRGGRTTIGHVTTMAGLPDERRRRLAGTLAGAGVGIVVLPPTDLYLQGRAAPVAELLDAGVATALSSNNVRNAFTPFGTVDLLDVTLLAAHTQPFGTPEGLDRLLDLATSGAAGTLGVPGHDLTVGSRADLVVLDAPGADHHTALLDRAPRRHVVSAGVLVAETVTTATLHGIRTATMMEA